MTKSLIPSLFVLLLSAVGAQCRAATVAAPSCALADVRAAVLAANDGDTVTIPAGVCSWSSTLTVEKGIALIGAGAEATVLQDSVPKGDVSCQGGGPLMAWNVSESHTLRISGFTVRGAAPDPNVCNKGHLTVQGTTKSFRVDHLSFTEQRTAGMRIDGYLWGLVDHCTFSGDFKNGIVIGHTTWGGASWGDGSWAEPLYWGSERAVYIEDCSFIELNTQFRTGGFDVFDGGRVVFRHNQLRNQAGVTHGTDSAQRHRSSRLVEMYNNTFAFDSTHYPPNVMWIRGGTGVFFNNTVTAPSLSTMIQLKNCRDADAQCGSGPNYPPWGACDGSSAYDQNSSGQSGYRCVDQPGAGTSHLLSGTTPPAGWVGNTLDPVYLWNNTFNGVQNNSVSASLHVQAGRDYYAGVARPNYTPYPYPHPLQGGGDTLPPAPPENLRKQ